MVFHPTYKIQTYQSELFWFICKFVTLSLSIKSIEQLRQTHTFDGCFWQFIVVGGKY